MPENLLDSSRDPFDIHRAIDLLKREVRAWRLPSVSAIAKRGRDPYRVLISCLISLRTKDAVTHEAGARLFAIADTPEKMLRLSEDRVAEIIFPAGFYRTKARTILFVSREILERHGGRVPDTLEELLTLKGVGRKTANLVLIKGHEKPGICVDTHVHRIVNRWGYVKSRTPDETEMILRKKLPKPYWKIVNDLLVTYGQNRCKPVSPLCSECPLGSMCSRTGVVRSR